MGLRAFWKCGSLSLLVALAAACALLNSCSSLRRTAVNPPHVEGAEFVGNKACADCHHQISRQFPDSAHGQFYREDVRWAPVAGCESCHGAGSKHVEAGGGRGAFMVNPGKAPDACFQCHLAQHAEFKLPQRHPVIEGLMQCSQCHDPHGPDIMRAGGFGLAMARSNEGCASCHTDQARPFVFEHEALREGCTTCHQPHGAVNEKLLTERDANLCLKCHAQIQGADVAMGDVFIGKVPHGAFLGQGTCWSAGCHTAVHGSNINPLMLY